MPHLIASMVVTALPMYCGGTSIYRIDSQLQVNQLLAHGRWFSPGTPGSSTTKTGRHDVAEILLKVALNTLNQIYI
jgi:hypothetical protein